MYTLLKCTISYAQWKMMHVAFNVSLQALKKLKYSIVNEKYTL